MPGVLPVVLAVVAGFSDRALDLLLTFGPQVFAEPAPVENRGPTPEVAFDPVLGLLKRFVCTSRMHPLCLSFCACLPKARACLFSFTPRHFWGRNRLTQTRRLRVISIRRMRSLRA
jgi:hypothetical protein